MCLHGQQARDVFERVAQIHVQRFQVEFAGFYFGEVQDVVDHGEQCSAAFADGLRVVTLHRIEFGFQQQLAHPDHTVHRRADLMAHVGQELALRPVCGSCRLRRFDQGLLIAFLLVDVLRHAAQAQWRAVLVAFDRAAGAKP